MNDSEIVILLFAVRILIPFGLLILIGEWMSRREARYWFRM